MYFTVFLPKCYCYGSLHTEKLMMIHGNVAPTKKSVCQLLLTETLNLAQRDYSSTLIVSMPPRRHQTISSDEMLPIIGLRRTGLKQTDIANQFGVGQSDISRILSEHHQKPAVPKTGHAKEEPKIQIHERTGSWLGWQCRTWPSPALSLPGNGGMVSKLDCPDSQSVVRYLLQGFAADSPENKLHWLSGTKGNVRNEPDNIAREKYDFGTAKCVVMNLDSVSSILMGVSGDDMAKITIKTVFSQDHRH